MNERAVWNHNVIPRTERGENLLQMYNECAAMEVQLEPFLVGLTWRQRQLQNVLQNSTYIFYYAYIHNDIYAPDDGRYAFKKEIKSYRTRPRAGMSAVSYRRNLNDPIPHSGMVHDEDHYSVLDSLEKSLYNYYVYLSAAMDYFNNLE